MSTLYYYQPYPLDVYNMGYDVPNYIAPIMVTGQVAYANDAAPQLVYQLGYPYNIFNTITNTSFPVNPYASSLFTGLLQEQETQPRSRSSSTSSSSSTPSKYKIIKYLKRNKEEQHMKRVREWEEGGQEEEEGYNRYGRKKSQDATAYDDSLAKESNRAARRRKGKEKRKQQPREGITNYHYASEVPPKLKKYWEQRYELFSRYDEDIWMTENSWFEVTPEAAAIAMANRVFSSFSEPTVVLDAFAGVGGNSIQFAMHPMCKHVYAIEIDPVAIECAIHNAQVYGVADKITFVNMDTFEFFNTRKINGNDEDVHVDAIFMSPPWGGPQYSSHDIFDLEKLKPYPFSKIYNEASKITPDLCFFLPRTSDLNQLADYAMPGERITAVHYCLAYRSKGLCSYHGRLGTDQSYHVDDPDIALREDRHTL